MKTAIAFGAVLLFAAAPSGRTIRADHPFLGTWEMQVTETCQEADTNRADGTTYAQSGEEITTSTYSISDKPDERGAYVLIDTIASSNGKPDCMGGTTPVGDVATVYLKFSVTGKSMLVCYDATMRQCFSMKRVPDL